MNTPIKNSHCSYCGSKFTEQKLWPRKCFICYNESYTNPTPVSVVILDSWEGNKLGTLIQRRNIEPQKGEWALTGGYINPLETWQEAAVRELYEEIGLETNINNFQLLDVVSSDSKANMLIFGLYTCVVDMKDIHFVPNEEVSEIKLINKPIELAFPSHTEMLRRHLKGPFSDW